ncbi:hypothetical protein C1H76_2164 [Elsinoe australis]|uniref:Uncharacterized protein n=1 Tax=Elsinoe australis TaxID=40998 RepID=A0A4U7BB68_9PEZI|nr:hypothetical protein C1H76_2164 [Elsinoe australis]
MTTVNQDYPAHARPRRSHSPHLPPIQDTHSSQAAHSQATVTDAWTAAFARLQDQVHYNSTALDEQRRHLADLHDAMRAMHGDIGAIWRHVDATREELSTRLGSANVVRPEQQDIDVLTQHLQSVDRKANEVEGLRVQLEVMTQRLRRLEEAQSASRAPPAAAPVSYHQPGQAQQYQQHQPHCTPSTEQRTPHQSQAADSRPPPQPTTQHPAESRPAAEHVAGSDGRNLPGFRALDPGSGVTSWRAASAHGNSQHAAVPHEATSTPHHEPAHNSGWAAVNAAGHGKRPASIDAAAPHDNSAPASPKRQKLATLMPRSSVGDQAAAHAQYPHPEAIVQPQRTASGDSQAHFSAGNPPANPVKFVPYPPNVEAAVAQQEAWRNDQAAAAEAGRGRGRGGKVKGSRSRKSGSEGAGDEPELKTEYEHSEWAGSQADYYRHPHHTYAISPQDVARGRELQPAGYPPEGHYAGSGQETPSPAFQESGKKSRTKPTRNANGILIRKDGRPDMRSISSAQNLRKVHAKKEAERNGDSQQGDPVSATSSVPTNASNDDRSSVMDGSNNESPLTPTADSQDKRNQIVHRGFASINDERREDSYMRRDESSVPDTQLRQPSDNRSERSLSRNSNGYEQVKTDGDTQMTDSVMMDRAEAEIRERAEKAPEITQRAEPSAVTA